jgi:hypothetical protein
MNKLNLPQYCMLHKVQTCYTSKYQYIIQSEYPWIGFRVKTNF